MLCKGGKKMDLSAKAVYASFLANLSFVGAALLSALGGWDDSLRFLIGIMTADYVLGILIALVWHKSQKSADGTFESNASLKGLLRKFSVLLVVYVAVQLDTAQSPCMVPHQAVRYMARAVQPHHDKGFSSRDLAAQRNRPGSRRERRHRPR